MARTIKEIYDQIVNTYVADAASKGVVVADPATWRQVSRRRMWANAQAMGHFIVETLFDTHKKDVDATIATMKPHSGQWYVEHAKKFQFGFNLVPGTDYYDNTGIAEDVVEASKIIKFAAFVKDPFVRLKVAKLNGTSLAKLSPEELTAFRHYMALTKDAGVKLKDSTITSNDPDQLSLTLRFFYNPLVLNEFGQDRDAKYPVPDAIRSYLQNIDFNGLFSIQELNDYVQAVTGYKDHNIDAISTQYGLLPFTTVDVSFVPDSGYLVIDDAKLLITYTPK